ncbi:hypothetical protein ACFP9V_24655 [Deinococcus radiopugnans]|uniref:ZIP family zinc transporter n=1 Tax=Deinococcus radiopugnans ATCC 19172 TaxID=585398 RepID=A0ABR6P170_9DEIO|nr:hypothetical protein [Deinococcus radiopugnans]MBB6018911.1 ZIP family zinc transporter [Deinococcus radiopugnans ATCC 19172]
MIALNQILLLTLTPVLATVLGGVVAGFRPPSPRVRSFVQHFAAGRQPLGVVIGFALGMGVMIAVRALVGRLDP